MKYLLDTNVCVRYLNGESEVLRRRLQSTNLQDLAVCSFLKFDNEKFFVIMGLQQ